MTRHANKRIFVEKIADSLRLPRKHADAIVKTVLEVMEACITTNEGLALKGFGTFRLRVRKGRNYKHPLTGEGLVVPDKATVVFKPSESYLERLQRRGISKEGGLTPDRAVKPTVSMTSRTNSG